MRTSKAGIELMHHFESCSLEAYPDPGTGGKPWTIGWGSTTDEAGNPIRPGTVWTQAQCDRRFELDLVRFEKAVLRALAGNPATQPQFDALVSLTYNVGEANLRKSTLMRLHNAGKYSEAAAQFIRWNKAAGKVMRGLTRRRQAEAALYQS
jgi:lysozyme